MKKDGKGLVFALKEGSDPKSKMKLLLTNLIVAFIFAGFWYHSFYSSDDSRSASVEVLHKEFSGISVPAGVRATHEITVTSKRSVNAVEQHYLSEIPLYAMFSDYDKQLDKRGWQYLRKIYGGRGPGKIYCKGDIEASIEVLSTGDDVAFEYSFSMLSGQVARVDCSG